MADHTVREVLQKDKEWRLRIEREQRAIKEWKEAGQRKIAALLAMTKK